MNGTTASMADMAATVGIGTTGSYPRLASPALAAAAEPDKPPVGEVETTVPLTELATHVGAVYEENALHRREKRVEERLEAQRLMSIGRYSADEEAKIRNTGAQLLYAPVADKKRRAAAAMLSELFNNPGDKCWTLAYTPSPDVPEWVRKEALAMVTAPALEALAAERGGNVTAEDVRRMVLSRVEEVVSRREEFARRACRLMETKIHDQMVEGGWSEAFNDYVEDLCVYGTAVIRGPEPRRRRTLKYQDAKGGGRVRMVEDVALEFEAVSPWDVYPAPGARDISDGPLVIRVRYLPEDLKLAASEGGKSGWLVDSVEQVLRASPQGGFRDWTAEGQRPEGRDGAIDTAVALPEKTCMLVGLEFFGSVRGSELLGIGMRVDLSEKPIDAETYYEVDAIRMDSVIVYCRIVEPELGRPLVKGVFFKQPDSWWGVGPMEKCRDMQRIANACVRNLAVNMAQASGPQFAITDMQRLDPLCGTDMTPWKMWRFGPPAFGQGGNADPIKMFQPNSNAAELLRVYDWADKECGNLAGIRDYTMGGNGAGEIGRTASGYSMLMESSTRDFKHAVHQTDVDVIRKTVMRCYAWNMLYEKDESIKGDVRCNPAGMYGMIHKEQDYNRKMQFLQLINNPTDMQIVGIPGRARLLREIARPMEMSLDGIVKSPEKLEEEQRMAEMMQRAQLMQQMNAVERPEEGEVGSSGAAPSGREGGFRGTNAGRRATVPQPGTGMTPQARGTMAYVSRNPEARAMQGLRASQTREANRAAMSA